MNVLADAVTVAHGDQGTFAGRLKRRLARAGRPSTDRSSGLAEVAYFDGSWQRIEYQTTLTLTELVDIEGGKVVRDRHRPRAGVATGRKATTDELV